MPVTQLNPYLMFNGDAAKAIALYESALGAKTVARMTYDGIPGMEAAPEGQKDRIIHAMLQIGGGAVMISDCHPNETVAPGSTIEVCLHYEDTDEMAKAFDALAASGKVVTPLGDMFWGARWGQLKDAFGISWMFNCQLDKNQEPGCAV